MTGGPSNTAFFPSDLTFIGRAARARSPASAAFGRSRATRTGHEDGVLGSWLWASVACASGSHPRKGAAPPAPAPPAATNEARPIAFGVPALFGEHMVLQRDRPNPIWGTDRPTQTVSVSIDGKAQSSVADENGRWRAMLPAFPAGGPHVIEIRGSETRRIEDVVFGEVWLASGQSNMEFELGRASGAATVIPAAKRPELRMFTVKRNVAAAPAPDVTGSWQVSSPETAPRFSAVAYFFAEKIRAALGVPVGIVHSSWGGTPAEAWTSSHGARRSRGDEAARRSLCGHRDPGKRSGLPARKGGVARQGLLQGSGQRGSRASLRGRRIRRYEVEGNRRPGSLAGARSRDQRRGVVSPRVRGEARRSEDRLRARARPRQRLRRDVRERKEGRRPRLRKSGRVANAAPLPSSRSRSQAGTQRRRRARLRSFRRRRLSPARRASFGCFRPVASRPRARSPVAGVTWSSGACRTRKSCSARNRNRLPVRAIKIHPACSSTG